MKAWSVIEERKQLRKREIIRFRCRNGYKIYLFCNSQSVCDDDRIIF